MNNPAIGLETRRYLRSLAREGGALDESCLAMIERALAHVRPTNPCGWVYMIADALGAPPARAMEAASFVELYYTMCSFTDDVQYGDVPAYIPDLDGPMQVNVMMQLLCVTVARGCHLARSTGNEAALAEIENAFLIGATMLRGQRYEITREDWSVDRYTLVAELSAGRQFELYLRIAAMASGVDPDLLTPLGIPLGILIQLKHDLAEGDSRLDGLTAGEIGKMSRSAEADLEGAVSRVPEPARGIVDRMIEIAKVESLEEGAS